MASSNIFRTNNFTDYTEQFNYPQFQSNDRIKETLYDINYSSCANPDNKNDAVLVIDSSQRNHDKYPSSSKYKVFLDKVYKDVVQVELSFALIPNASYIINESNNKFYFQDNEEQVRCGSYHVICLPIGNWRADSCTEPSIRSNLEKCLNKVNSNKYKVKFNIHLIKFTIKQVSGSGIFNLIFSSGKEKYGSHGEFKPTIAGVDPFITPNIPVGEHQRVYMPQSAGSVLGFSRKNFVGSTCYTSDLVANLNRDRYVILKIEGMERVDSNSNAVQNAFCILGMDNTPNSFVFNRDVDNVNKQTYSKYFISPIPEVNQFTVTLLNCHGELFDSNGTDHVLVFQITSLSRFDNFTGNKC